MTTLVVRLTHAAPDFPSRTTTTAFCAVPVNLPVSAEGTTVLPGSGPFTVEEFVPSQKLVLVRNPLYHGARPRHVDEIVFSSAGDPVGAVERGAADYAEADPQALAAVPTRYRSPAARCRRDVDQVRRPQLGPAALSRQQCAPPRGELRGRSVGRSWRSAAARSPAD